MRDSTGQSLRTDTLYGQPARQGQRAAAMAQLIPDPAEVWDELLVGNFARFEAA